MALDGQSVLGCGGRLAADGDVLAQVAFGEGGKGGAGGLRGRALCEVLAGFHTSDDEGCAPAGLARADDAVAADGCAPGARRATGLHDIDPCAGGIDADAEAGERTVPQHPVPAGREPVDDRVGDRAVRQFIHGERPPLEGAIGGSDVDASRVHRATRKRERAAARHHRHHAPPPHPLNATQPSSRKRTTASPRNAPESPDAGRKHAPQARLNGRSDRTFLISAVLKGFIASLHVGLFVAPPRKERSRGAPRPGPEASSLLWRWNRSRRGEKGTESAPSTTDGRMNRRRRCGKFSELNLFQSRTNNVG